MSCTVTEDGPCRRTLTFEVDRSKLEEGFEAGVARLARSARIKGFRPGKVPTALIRKTHGDSLREEVRRQVMREAFAEAIQEHSLRPVGDPELNLENLDDEGDGPFTFEFAVEVVPEIPLEIPDEIPVTVTLAEVTDEMVDGEIQRLKEQRATLEDAPEDHTAEKDDILEGTAVYVVDGDELEPRDQRAVFLRHDLVDSIRIEGSHEKFLGTKAGDTVEIDVTLPEHFAPNEHAGKEATLRFTTDRIRLMIVPDFDGETLGKMGVADEDELRARVSEELEAQRARVLDQQTDHLVAEQLLEGHDFELPSRLLTKAIEHKVHEYAHRLMQERGMESEAGHHAAEEHRAEIAESTERGLRVAFLLTTIAELHDLSPTRQEAEEQVKSLAVAQGQDPQEALQRSMQEGWLADVHEQLVHQKARDWLRGRAKVTVETPKQDGSEGTLESSDEG